jgi:hypothetical protein
VNIRLAANVLQDSRWFPALDVLLDIVSQPYSHASLDPSQFGQISSSPWLKNATGPREVLAEMIRGAARTMSRQTPVTAVTLEIDADAPTSGEILPTATMRFTPLKAIALLAQPLQIIVEDETSDGGFLLWMARLLGKDSIRAAYRAGRVSFRHAGGKRQMLKSARAMTFGVWPRDGRPIMPMKLRSCAILDSDSHFAGDDRNATIKSQLEPHVGFVHILEGRTIENYVPRKHAEDRLRGAGPAVAAYFSLSEEQRRYFPLKTGFRDEATPPQPQSMSDFKADNRWHPKEKMLFDGISDTNWQRFSGGFGDSLAAVYQEEAYRCAPGAAHLLTVAQQQEIENLLVTIINHI